jgi:hypothetical protein
MYLGRCERQYIYGDLEEGGAVTPRELGCVNQKMSGSWSSLSSVFEITNFRGRRVGKEIWIYDPENE